MPLFVDATEPRPLAFVSHAHADHVANHGHVIATPATCDLLEARGYRFRRQPRAYLSAFEYGPFRLELLDAGHCLGSAMLRLERDDKVTLYAGDLGRPGGLTSGTPHATRCDDLVVEASVLPGDDVPSLDEAAEELLLEVGSCLRKGVLPIVAAWSLGAAQEAAAIFEAAGIDSVADEAVTRVTRVYREHGLCFDRQTQRASKLPEGKVLLVSRANPKRFDVAAKKVRRILLGTSRANLMEKADVLVPLTDHASMAELVAFVESCGSPRVWTTGAHAARVAAHLRDAGFRSRPFEAPPQLELF